MGGRTGASSEALHAASLASSDSYGQWLGQGDGTLYSLALCFHKG